MRCGCVVVVSEYHVGGTRNSGIVSSAADVLWMSVVRVIRGVGGACEMGMCLAQDSVGVEGGGRVDEKIEFGVYPSCILCLADACVSSVHPVVNPVSPYGYLLPTM